MRHGRIERSDGPGVPRAWMADRWWSRLRGLLGRAPLAADGSEALLIRPCASVHTLGMGYPLDLVFLDREGAVLGWREQLRPWRAAACRNAAVTVEFHGGALQRLQPRQGEYWRWEAGAGDGAPA